MPSLSSDRCDGAGPVFIGVAFFTGLGAGGGGVGFGVGAIGRMAVDFLAGATVGGGIGAGAGSGGGESNPVMRSVNPGDASPPALSAVKYSE